MHLSRRDTGLEEVSHNLLAHCCFIPGKNASEVVRLSKRHIDSDQACMYLLRYDVPDDEISSWPRQL
jgi:hypothetical protein